MLGVVGTNHKIAPLSIREQICAAFAALPLSGVFLSTCNRVEYYFHSKNPAKTQQEIIRLLRTQGDEGLTSYLYTFFGQECVHHLERVVCGLDSLFCAETEIQGQVKRAYETVRNATLPKALHILFQKALHTGKIIRRCFQPPKEEITDHIRETVSAYLSKGSSDDVLLIGASAINLKIAHKLKEDAISMTIANRTKERARAAASQIGAKTLPWDCIQSAHCHFPCVISATRSPEYVIDRNQTFSNPQLFIDLGVPRNIDPYIESSLTKVVNIDSFVPTSSSFSMSQIERVLFRRSKKDFFTLSNKCQTR